MLSNQSLKQLLEEESKIPAAPWVIEAADSSMICIGTECNEMKGCVELYHGHAYAITRCKACYDRGSWDEHPCYAGKSEVHKTVIAMRNAFREVVEELISYREKYGQS